MRSMRKTEPFGSKQLRVGKSNFELCLTDSPHHRVLPARADNHREEEKLGPRHQVHQEPRLESSDEAAFKFW